MGQPTSAPGPGRHPGRHGLGAAIAAFGLVDTLWIALVLLAVAGWADVVSAVLRNTILQTTIPDRFRSRMSSIQMAVVQGGPRLGDMESGAVATATSIEFSVVSGGLACIVGAGRDRASSCRSSAATTPRSSARSSATPSYDPGHAH